MTELQRSYPNVIFIGVSVGENHHYYTVKAYVQYRRAEVDYRVAMDRPVEGRQIQHGRTRRTGQQS